LTGRHSVTQRRRSYFLCREYSLSQDKSQSYPQVKNMSKLLEQIYKEKKHLGSVLEVTSSKRIYLSEYKKQGTPFFRSKEIIEAFKGKQISSELFISNDRYNEIKNKFGVPQKDDILLTSIGTIGIPFRVTNDKPFYFKDGNLTWFRNYNGIDSLYLYYWIISTKGQSQIESNSIGSSQSALTIDSIKKLEIDLPDLPTQKKIAGILSAYDAKIENNNKIIKNLELTAQTIFNEWFINFRFPGYEKAKMVESEMGEIPAEWNVGKISDFGNVVCGKTPSKSESIYFGGEIPFIKIPDMHSQMFIVNTEDSLTQAGVNTQKNQLIPEGSICVSCIATVGLVSITTKDSQTNQQINSVVPKNRESTEYLYFTLVNKKNDLKAIGSGGSTTLNINTSVFSNLEVLIPNDQIIKLFHQKVSPSFKAVKHLINENISLKQSRDQLLAKLI